MTSQELVQRIPPEIEKAGVQIEVDESGTYRALVFPPEIHQHFNVLLPTAEVVKADPNWSPAIKTFQVDIEKHTYHDANSRQGERSLNKRGLVDLARTAGLGFPITSRLPVAQLRDNEIGWQATVVVRRSDGTEEPFTSSKIVNLDVEEERIRQEIRASDRYQNDAQRRGAFEKRWLYERTHVDAKAETKAIERTIRLALAIPHSFSEKALALPFLVVAYSLTPDWSDPDVRRILLERAVSARNQLYPSAPAGEIQASPAAPSAGAESGEEAGADDRSSDKEGEVSGSTQPEAPASDTASPEDDFAGDEPGVDPQISFDAPEGPPAEAVRVAAEAALHVVQFGRKHKGLTLEQIAKERRDAGYVLWLADSMDPKTDLARETKTAAKVYADVFLRSQSS